MRQKPASPNNRGANFFIGIGILTALMLVLFWPVVKYLVSILPGW